MVHRRGVERQRLGRRQAGGIEDVGEHGPHGGPPLPADVAEDLDGGPPTPARLHAPIGEPAALVLASGEPTGLAQAEPAVAADEPPARLRREGRKPHAIAVEAIGEDQGVPREGPQRGLRPRQFPGGRIGIDDERPTQAPAQVVDREEAAREHHRPLGPEELQAVGDGGKAGAIHHDHSGKPGLEGGQVGGIPRRGGRQELGGEPGEDRGEEGRPERLAPLEEGRGARLDVREEGLRAFQRLVEGLAQGPGGPEDHGEPELHEGLQRPAPLAFPDAGGGEDGLAEGGGDVGAQELQDADEIDRHRGRARSAHSPSFREKVYGPLV